MINIQDVLDGKCAEINSVNFSPTDFIKECGNAIQKIHEQDIKDGIVTKISGDNKECSLYWLSVKNNGHVNNLLRFMQNHPDIFDMLLIMFALSSYIRYNRLPLNYKNIQEVYNVMEKFNKMDEINHEKFCEDIKRIQRIVYPEFFTETLN